MLRLEPLLLELEEVEYERLLCETEALLLDLVDERELLSERDLPDTCRVAPPRTGWEFLLLCTGTTAVPEDIEAAETPLYAETERTGAARDLPCLAPAL